MKYLSTISFAICFAVFLLFTENFMVSMNAKIMFWDYMSTVLSREAFMSVLGWGIALIFLVFVSYTLTVAALLAFSLAKPKIVIQVRLDNLATGHLLLIGVILMSCLCANPIYQIITNLYLLEGFANYLIWYLIPVAIFYAWGAIYAVVSAVKFIRKAFKTK